MWHRIQRILNRPYLVGSGISAQIQNGARDDSPSRVNMVEPAVGFSLGLSTLISPFDRHEISGADLCCESGAHRYGSDLPNHEVPTYLREYEQTIECSFR